MRVKLKYNTHRQQREAAELEAIIEAFGSAMRAADRGAMARWADSEIHFTANMYLVWAQYIRFCQAHPQ